MDDKEMKNVAHEKYMQWLQNKYYRIMGRRYAYVVFMVCILIYQHFNDISYASILFFLFFLILFIIHLEKYKTRWKSYEVVCKYQVFNMDQIYQTKLFIKLKSEGIFIYNKPIVKSPGKLVYFGEDSNNEEITFYFYNCHQEMINKYNYNYPMLIKYSYKKIVEQTIDEIDLCNDENVNKAVEIIKKAIEESK